MEVKMAVKSINLQGELPENFKEALETLKNELKLSLSTTGMMVTAEKGDCLRLEMSGGKAKIVWQKPIHIYRALSMLASKDKKDVINICETPVFEQVGVMFDVSRNAVLTVDTLKLMLRKMSLMGMNLGMMYTEDTYEIPERPFFGYQRGKYTYDELKEVDAYADMLGIELIPCIQTLGHLNRALHWPVMANVKDTAEILLVDSEETYKFIDEMLAAASAPYKSRRIHIGMDEATDIGLGVYRAKNGYVPGHTLMKRHMQRVMELVEKRGLDAMIWSDMYFRPDSPTNGYYDGPNPTAESIAAVHPKAELVYWDYYNDDEKIYNRMFEKHEMLNAPIVFAGGIWTWLGAAPNYEKTLETTLPALKACKKAGTKTVFATAWGDNGAECNTITTLLGLQIFSEYCYTGGYSKNQVETRFKECCNASFNSFFDLTRFNLVEGMRSAAISPANAAKVLLYQDPLIQIYERDLNIFPLSKHFAKLCNDMEKYKKENPEYKELFDFYKLLANAIMLKCKWHEQAGACVRTKNLAKAKELAKSVPEIEKAIENLRINWQKLWLKTNKPHGFEVIDVRLGGICARLRSAKARMEAFAAGKDDLPELMCEPLPYLTAADGSIHSEYEWGTIVSACKVNG